MPPAPSAARRHISTRLRLLLRILLPVIGLLCCRPAPAQTSTDIAALHRVFANPPDSSRIMMRWWWFGPAATKPEITRELEQMKAGGIGGVEVASLYALGLDDPSTGFRNTPFLSDEHIDTLRFAAQEARRLGLRMDVTLGSGWPFGGPHIPVTQAAGKLRVERYAIAAGETSALAPFVDAGEAMISAYLLPASISADDIAHAQPLPPPASGRYTFPAAAQPRALVCFISSRTGMNVKRPSVGAAGFVLDHYDPAATANHLHAVGDRLLSAFGDQPPYAVFSDSLEDYGSDWSPALLSEFQRRRGYDLRPHLLALVADAGPDTAAIRHDWGRTLTEMADDGFLKPLHAWAEQHHTLFRSQTYGFPPVSLSSNRFADLPEGEGKATFQMWREFSDTRWAASAGHLFHHPVVSSETWTWLHSPAFRATPLDMKAEADLHFLQGINQLIGHGWPYSPPSAPEPGWRMYAAAAFDAHNPWYFAMPDLTRYLQRVSFALRQGEPANDVALLLPTDDVWASFKAGYHQRSSPTSPGGFDQTGSNVTVDEQMGKVLGKQVIAQILDAGFNVDFIDADTIDSIGIPYRVLILPDVDRLPVATYEKIVAFARKGGIVIATRRMPATAPGLLNAAEDSARVNELSQTLFHGAIPSAHFIQDETQLGANLAQYAAPDMTLSPRTPQIGFIHRKVAGGNLYFVANTSNEEKHVQAQFRDSAHHAETWDAFSGEVSGLPDATHIALDLAPYESRLIYFSDAAMTAAPQPAAQESVRMDLSRQWKVTFGETGLSEDQDHLASWSDDAKTQFYSGVATYRKSFNLQHAAQPHGARLLLDFGPGIAESLPSPSAPHTMRAYIVPPVREAAEVYLNGKRAGVVWRPPYRLDVTAYVHDGENDLRIVVGNTAINSLAGQPLPDYRLLRDRYGLLFIPQDMENLHPLPSGILGPVTLVQSVAAR
ncbi:MAG: glycoside hydrolase [Acidobacteriota bacterium]|nr:glycoside hydrolase [Acidobacteriota bacterium]